MLILFGRNHAGRSDSLRGQDFGESGRIERGDGNGTTKGNPHEAETESIDTQKTHITRLDVQRDSPDQRRTKLLRAM